MRDLLLEKKLLNDGLVTLTPQLVERYNRCLARANITPTRRKTIEVDGAGWSPQIAKDKRDPHYLGTINPIAILVDPKQYRMPLYAWPFSWMRDAIDFYIRQYHREFFDIAASHSILLDLDNGLSDLQDPRDLFLLTEITAKPDTGTLSEGAKQQASLIERYRAEPLSCLDGDLQEALIKSRRLVGDLRKRKIDIGPATFSQFADFYTVACEGAAVLRNVDGQDLLVLESQKVYDSIGEHDGPKGKVLYLYDESEEVFRRLRAAGWLEVPVDSFREYPELLEDKKDVLLAMLLADSDEKLEWGSLSWPKRRSIMNKAEHRSKVRLYHELERYAATLKSGQGEPEVSQELWYYLTAPTERVPPPTQDVLWLLLTRKEPRRILELYTYDKNRFLVEYDEWSRQKQVWVADYLEKHYQKRMKQR